MLDQLCRELKIIHIADKILPINLCKVYKNILGENIYEITELPGCDYPTGCEYRTQAHKRQL